MTVDLCVSCLIATAAPQTMVQFRADHDGELTRIGDSDALALRLVDPIKYRAGAAADVTRLVAGYPDRFVWLFRHFTSQAEWFLNMESVNPCAVTTIEGERLCAIHAISRARENRSRNDLRRRMYPHGF